MRSSFDLLVHDLYEAAITAEQTESMLKRLSMCLGADVAVQRIGMAPGAFVMGSSPQDPAAVSSYVQHYGTVDPWLANLPKVAQCGVLSCASLMPYDALIRTEFYNDFLQKNHLHWGMAAIIDPAPATASYLTIMCAKSRGDFDSGSIQHLTRLLPHLQAATRIQRRLGQAVTAQRPLVQALDKIQQGILLLDAARRIMYANRAAEQLFAREWRLGARNGRLFCRVPSDDRTLQALVAGACRTDCSVAEIQPGGMRIGGTPEGGYLDIRVSPFRAAHQWQDANEPVAVVHFGAAPPVGHDAQAILVSLHGLTATEIRCAIAIARGAAPSAIAADFGVRPSTVRAHIRALHAKFGVKRDGALVAKLNTVLAMHGLFMEH